MYVGMYAYTYVCVFMYIPAAVGRYSAIEQHLGLPSYHLTASSPSSILPPLPLLLGWLRLEMMMMMMMMMMMVVGPVAAVAPVGR